MREWARRSGSGSNSIPGRDRPGIFGKRGSDRFEAARRKTPDVMASYKTAPAIRGRDDPSHRLLRGISRQREASFINGDEIGFSMAPITGWPNWNEQQPGLFGHGKASIRGGW